MRAKIAVVSGVAAVVANLGLLKKPRDIRAPNQVRDRLSVKAKILSMNPRHFKRQYRLERETFMTLLSDITPLLEKSDEGTMMGVRSSGSIIDPLLMLAITLRMLAGGSYLDIAFGYHVAESSVYGNFHKNCMAIYMQLDNIHFPYSNEEKLRLLEQNFLKYCPNVEKLQLLHPEVVAPTVAATATTPTSSSSSEPKKQAYNIPAAETAGFSIKDIKLGERYE